MVRKKKRSYYWSPNGLFRHRKTRLRNALGRGDENYLEERQKKILRIIPNSLMGIAKITFSKSYLKSISDRDSLENTPTGLKTFPNNEETTKQ